MPDSLTPEERSRNMAAIKGKNTRPEIAVRSYLHKEGFRYRLHKKDLPGKPDIVLKKYNTVLFINGCFWHRHKDCRYAYTPKSNLKFWQNKFDKNVENDLKKHEHLKKLGWNVVVIWECQIKKQGWQKWLKDRIINNV
ncbi:very short patch repair endonuclease [Legionella septentrionalis]|uniref:very short patch repair endonuclease n=1 Tax=Legionella septentrionalis TaxID=2498109 RepID=UPI000F8C982D|nr:very short patch repair endonuclease [Legionella septentrionalis]RUR14027.1 DNA mismatch endonuclease Vsr [Legionella septentrionalis]